VLILASASQSRKQLLENCQIEFIQIASNFDETSIKEKNIFNKLNQIKSKQLLFYKLQTHSLKIYLYKLKRI